MCVIPGKKVLTTGYPRQGPKNDTQNVKKRRKNAKTDSKTKEKMTPKFAPKFWLPSPRIFFPSMLYVYLCHKTEESMIGAPIGA